jgi:hypothetical protein
MLSWEFSTMPLCLCSSKGYFKGSKALLLVFRGGYLGDIRGGYFKAGEDISRNVF